MLLPSSPFVPAIALRWQKNVTELREYEVIRDGNIFRSNLSCSSLFSSEFEQAQRLKNELLEKYRDEQIETIFPGEDMVTESGSTFCIHTWHDMPEPLRQDDYKERILNDLTLIQGIGPVTAHRLRGRGFFGVRDLLYHPKYREEATRFLSHFDNGEAFSLMEWIGKRHRRSHPLILSVAGGIEKGGFTFLDIETLGIFSRPIILIGLASLEDGRVHVTQYLLRDIEEEPAALEATFCRLHESTAFVSFNGKSFDIPYLQERAAYYGMPFPSEVPHFDLLHFSRRRWKGSFPNCRLQTLEKSLFGIQRELDIPSALVPEFYESYFSTGSPGPLIPIVEHNRQDVLSLVLLFHHLVERAPCP
ncbi:MAG: ribonuclease H-like domain-containing protein [Methanomicrobiales archaeon]|nr:ribonuclease H-like domain-containing protein [Methanomicrobiales archaeon]